MDDIAFIKLFLMKLYERGKISINKKALSVRLRQNFYANESYRRAFFSNLLIGNNYADNLLNFDLSDSLSFLVSTSILTYNFEDKNILRFYQSGENLETYFTDLKMQYSQEELNLMDKMVDEYIIISEIEDKNSIKLNIIGINPNDRDDDYVLYYSEGYKAMKTNNSKFLSSYDDTIIYQLVTDGYPVNHYSIWLGTRGVVKLCRDKNCTISDPESETRPILLERASARSIILKNASFAALQFLKNGIMYRVDLYTDILDKDKLDMLASISTTPITNLKDIRTRTKAAPHVYQIKSPIKDI